MSLYQILHALGLLLGFGGAVVSCAIMLRLDTDDKRLRRGRIARRICIATWAGLLLLIVSGIGLTIGFAGEYPAILALKHLFVAVIFTDAAIIHFRLFPRYFRQIGTPDFDKTYNLMKRIGILSMSSWVLSIILSPLLAG